MSSSRDYKTVNVSTETLQLLQDISAVTGEPMKEITEAAIKSYLRASPSLRKKVAVYREVMGRIEGSKE